MELKNVITRQKDEILFVTISREEKLNALNDELICELHTVFSDASANESIGGVILTGAGEKAFAAGADIAAFKSLSPADAENLARNGQEKVFDLIENLGKPVLAAINGFALGGGLELAMACHMRLAAEHAKMGLPEVTLGLIPGYGGTQRLVQLAGKGKAMEMILSGNFISAQEAESCGLVNKVCPKDELISEAEKMMLSITRNSPEALALAIKAVLSGIPDSGFENEIKLFGASFSTENSQEGISAFLEKRKPAFKRGK